MNLLPQENLGIAAYFTYVKVLYSCSNEEIGTFSAAWVSDRLSSLSIEEIGLF